MVGGARAAASVSKMGSPCLRAVSSTVVTAAWTAGPHSERKLPQTLRWTTELRSACSAALLVGGTRGSYKNTNSAARCSRKRTHKRLASAPGTGSANKRSQGASVALMGAMDGPPEYFLALPRPGRLFFVDHVLQVAQLVPQTDLMAPRGRLELRFPQITDPGLRGGPGLEVRDGVGVAARHDHQIGGLGRLEDPLPVILPLHPGAGLIRPDHRTRPHLLPNRAHPRPQPLAGPRQDIPDRPLAQRQAEQVRIHALQARVAQVMVLVQIHRQRC